MYFYYEPLLKKMELEKLYTVNTVNEIKKMDK